MVKDRGQLLILPINLIVCFVFDLSIFVKLNALLPLRKMRKAIVSTADKLQDGWLRVIGIPLLAFISTFFFYSEEWIKYSNSFLFCFLSFLVVTSLVWYINRFILLYFRKTYASIEFTGRRILVQLVTSLAACGILSFVISWFYDVSSYWGRSLLWQDYLFDLLVVFIFVFLIAGIYEGVFFFSHWRMSVIETEELKKANLQSQFESLKNQVSPHFLFNSLNTLSSLIEENPETAIRFVNQLSKVYRYLLQSNEKELTTIKDELEFLDSYIFLLKTRFGEGLNFKVILPEEYLNSLIPPLTLQILVENAVKHNVVAAAKPLSIELRCNNEDIICVSNNKQKKIINVTSHGLGLANISAKYKLLNKPAIQVNDGLDEFIVSLPIIKI